MEKQMKRLFLAIAAFFCTVGLNAAPFSVSGRVVADKGEALQGVKVTDGYSLVRTDDQGAYTLDVHPDAGFVYLTIPSGYEVPERNGAPMFYRALDRQLPHQQADPAFIFPSILFPSLFLRTPVLYSRPPCFRKTRVSSEEYFSSYR